MFNFFFQAIELAVKFAKDRAVEVSKVACGRLIEIQAFEQVGNLYSLLFNKSLICS